MSLTSYLKDKFLSVIPDSIYLRYQYWVHFHRMLNLRNPKRFTEKIQWLKIHNRKPLYSKLVDKYEVRAYVGCIIGHEYLIPILGHWHNAEEIDFELLPSAFVLKTTHDSGGVLICKDKTKFDIEKARVFLNERLKTNVFNVTREWPYKNVVPSIIAETLLNPFDDNEIQDYKWYCFNGKPTFCQVIKDRRSKETIDFFDTEWNHLEFCGLTPGVKNSSTPIPMPSCLEKMIDVAERLSNGHPFMRVDLYEDNGNVYFGEMTFSPASGFGCFTPDKWDEIIGDKIQLAEIDSDNVGGG